MFRSLDSVHVRANRPTMQVHAPASTPVRAITRERPQQLDSAEAPGTADRTPNTATLLHGETLLECVR